MDGIDIPAVEGGKGEPVDLRPGDKLAIGTHRRVRTVMIRAVR